MRYVLAMALILLPAVSRADDTEAYQKAAESVVSVVAFEESGTSTGTGVVVVGDTILTARHVIANARTIGAIFPRRDEKGQIISNPGVYKTAVPCTVIATSVRRDLAVLALRQPVKPKAIKLTLSVTPGSHVFIIGAGADWGMWNYASGDVRQVYTLDHPASGQGIKIRGKIVETSVPANPGNSGGPILNARGELVGLMMLRMDGKDSVCMGIATSEIMDFMSEAVVEIKNNAELPITLK